MATISQHSVENRMRPGIKSAVQTMMEESAKGLSPATIADNVSRSLSQGIARAIVYAIENAR